MSVEPFQIRIPESDLEDLEKRLRNARYPVHQDEKWDRGVSGAYLTKLVDYWRHTYNWRDAERKLNDLDHYKTTISGIDIHFVHMRGKTPNRTPIILTHGWPDSFLRYTKLIPLLTDPERFGGTANDSFDVVIPSLPGFGFSGYSKDVSINNETIADIWLELMVNRLGYKKFIAAGGDIGSGVTRYLAFKYPGNILAIHLTDVGIIRELINPVLSSEERPSEEQMYTKSVNQWLNEEAGYMRLQATKPQTLAVGLSDSPVGLAAWISEKFHSWSDLNSPIPLEDTLTNIMIYWLNNNISTAAGIYYENSHFLSPLGAISAPTGVCLFPADILLPPRKWVEDRFNVIQWGVAPKGGHFTSMEDPHSYASELFRFLDKLK